MLSLRAYTPELGSHGATARLAGGSACSEKSHRALKSRRERRHALRPQPVGHSSGGQGRRGTALNAGGPRPRHPGRSAHIARPPPSGASTKWDRQVRRWHHRRRVALRAPTSRPGGPHNAGRAPPRPRPPERVMDQPRSHSRLEARRHCLGLAAWRPHRAHTTQADADPPCVSGRKACAAGCIHEAAVAGDAQSPSWRRRLRGPLSGARAGRRYFCIPAAEGRWLVSAAEATAIG